MIHQFADLYHLNKALNSKVMGTVLLGVSFAFIINPGVFWLILKIIIVACFLFVPYMLYVLYLYEKKSWIIGFVIWMFAAYIPSIFFTVESSAPGFLLSYLPLLFFLLYCWLLNQKTGEWIIEAEYWRDH